MSAPAWTQEQLTYLSRMYKKRHPDIVLAGVNQRGPTRTRNGLRIKGAQLAKDPLPKHLIPLIDVDPGNNGRHGHRTRKRAINAARADGVLEKRNFTPGRSVYAVPKDWADQYTARLATELEHAERITRTWISIMELGRALKLRTNPANTILRAQGHIGRRASLMRRERVRTPDKGWCWYFHPDDAREFLAWRAKHKRWSRT